MKYVGHKTQSSINVINAWCYAMFTTGAVPTSLSAVECIVVTNENERRICSKLAILNEA